MRKRPPARCRCWLSDQEEAEADAEAEAEARRGRPLLNKPRRLTLRLSLSRLWTLRPLRRTGTRLCTTPRMPAPRFKPRLWWTEVPRRLSPQSPLGPTTRRTSAEARRKRLQKTPTRKLCRSRRSSTEVPRRLIPPSPLGLTNRRTSAEARRRRLQKTATRKPCRSRRSSTEAPRRPSPPSPLGRTTKRASAEARRSRTRPRRLWSPSCSASPETMQTRSCEICSLNHSAGTE